MARGERSLNSFEGIGRQDSVIVPGAPWEGAECGGGGIDPGEKRAQRDAGYSEQPRVPTRRGERGRP